MRQSKKSQLSQLSQAERPASDRTNAESGTESVGSVDGSSSASAGKTWTFGPVDLSGVSKYLIIVRGETDPERQGNKCPKHRGWNTDEAALKTRQARGASKTGKLTAEAAMAAVVELLADGQPRTFNRICVELYDRTADVLCGGPVEAAMWDLAAEHRIEFTMMSPVLWRKAS